MHRITVYINDETRKIIEDLMKEERRSMTFIAEKLINKGIKETQRNRKGKSDSVPEN